MQRSPPSTAVALAIPLLAIAGCQDAPTQPVQPQREAAVSAPEATPTIALSPELLADLVLSLDDATTRLLYRTDDSLADDDILSTALRAMNEALHAGDVDRVREQAARARDAIAGMRDQPDDEIDAADLDALSLVLEFTEDAIHPAPATPSAPATPDLTTES